MSGFEKPDEAVDWSEVVAAAEETVEPTHPPHMVFVEEDAGGFRGACSCGWRGDHLQWDRVATFARRSAAQAAAVHGLAVW